LTALAIAGGILVAVGAAATAVAGVSYEILKTDPTYQPLLGVPVADMAIFGIVVAIIGALLIMADSGGNGGE
jgi:hypothetical protein